jgi:Uma2 family endonuclease
MARSSFEHRMSMAEHLQFEERSPVKREFADGKLFAMAGDSDEHDTISGSLYQNRGRAERLERP